MRELFKLNSGEIYKQDDEYIITGIVEFGILQDGELLNFFSDTNYVTETDEYKIISQILVNEELKLMRFHVSIGIWIPTVANRKWTITVLRLNAPFSMSIDDTWNTSVANTVAVSGTIMSGQLVEGTSIKITGKGKSPIYSKIIKIQLDAMVMPVGIVWRKTARVSLEDDYIFYLENITLDELKGMTLATTEGLIESSQS